MRILHIVDSLSDPGGAQVRLLAPALAKQHAIEVCCLGNETDGIETLRAAGVIVHVLGWTRWFDPLALWNLRSVVRDASPDLIQAWSVSAVRSVALIAQDRLPSVVLSAAVPASNGLAAWDRWLLAKVRCMAVAGTSEEQGWRSSGLTTARVAVIPPAVESFHDENARNAGSASILSLDGFRESIIAFDFLRLVFPEARLNVFDVGSLETSLRGLVAGLESEAVVRFHTADLPRLLGEATLVWLPRVTHRGRARALEAMARGCAVIAADVACIRELMEGETGILVPGGDVVALARQTRNLLLDPDLRAHIGGNAQRHVNQHYSLESVCQRWRDFYRLAAA